MVQRVGGSWYPFMLPIHLAANFGRIAAIEQLLIAWPAGACETSGFGCLPLDYVVGSAHPVDSVRVLLRGCPGCERQLNGYHRYPVEDALLRNAERSVIEVLVTAWPECFQHRNPRGQVMLHRMVTVPACAVDVITAVLKAWPGPGDSDVENSWAPNGNDVITAVLNGWPDGIRCKDDEGDIPLMTALRNSAPLPMIQALVKAWPESVQCRDRSGRIPIMAALQCGRDVGIIRELISAYPNSLQCTDPQGNVPINTAIQFTATVDVVQALLEAYPEAARIPNNDGKVALHYCGQFSDAAIVDCVFSAWPGALRCKDRQGNAPSVAPYIPVPKESKRRCAAS